MAKKLSKKKEARKNRTRGAAAKRRAETHKVGFEATAVKLPEGVERFKEDSKKPIHLDIIPFRLKKGNEYADAGEIYFEVTYWVHFNVGAEQSPYICLAKQCGTKCPICEWRAKEAKNEDADEKLIESLAPKQRQLFRVIDLKNEDKGIQLWDISFHNFGKKLDAEIRNSDEDDKYNEFYELEDGRTLKVNFSKESFLGNPFYQAESIHFKERKKDYDNDVLDEQPQIEDCLIILDYDELKAIHLQTTDTDSGSSKKSSKKETTEPEPEEEEDKSTIEKGDRVSAEIDGETYEGEVKKVKGDTAIVLFDDGDKADFDIDELTKLDAEEKEEEDAEEEDAEEEDAEEEDAATEEEPEFEKGDRISAEIDGETYEGVIKKIKGDEASIVFDDGDKMDLPLDRLTKLDADGGDEDEDDDDDDDDDDKPSTKAGKKGKCPGGGTFGKDTDELEACEDCPNWDACDDA